MPSRYGACRFDEPYGYLLQEFFPDCTIPIVRPQSPMSVIRHEYSYLFALVARLTS